MMATSKQAPAAHRRPAPSATELEFLPAALEIVETPPSPLGRAVGAAILLFFCIALTWAAAGQVDIVATALGKIVPTGRTKVVQPFEIGVVREILVEDGQRVRAGDVLIALDPTISGAESEHLQTELVAAQMDVARLRAILAEEPGARPTFAPPSGANPAQVATQRQLLAGQLAEERAKLAALDRQQAQKEAERASAAATVKRIQSLLPILEQQFEIRKTLYDHETGSKLNYLQAMREFTEQQQELEVQKSHTREAEAALAAITQTRSQAAAEFRRTRLDELAKAEQKAAELSQDLIKAQKRSDLQILTAPVDGVVQQLAVHTVGGIVTPAQPLLALVPADSGLEIEAMVSNRDIGFVHAGQDAEIKVQTFNFTRYGLLHAHVVTVSQDAISRDPPSSGEKGAGAGSGAAGSSEAPEAVYVARIALDATQMRIEGQPVSLSPGMAVIAEIKTGRRTILSYLLSPLRQYRQDSLRER